MRALADVPSGSRRFHVRTGEASKRATWGNTLVCAWFSRDGLLCVHKNPVPDCTETGWQRADGWHVTHVGTGLAIGSRKTKREALALRRLLEGLGSAWDFTDPENAKGIYPAVLALLSDVPLHDK